MPGEENLGKIWKTLELGGRGGVIVNLKQKKQNCDMKCKMLVLT